MALRLLNACTSAVELISSYEFSLNALITCAQMPIISLMGRTESDLNLADDMSTLREAELGLIAMGCSTLQSDAA